MLLRFPSLDTSRENFLCVAGAFALGVLDGMGNGGREEGGGGGGGGGSCYWRRSWWMGGTKESRLLLMDGGALPVWSSS